MSFRARAITHQNQISSYHRLVRRINHQVSSSPKAMAERQATLAPEPHDNPEDWERLLSEIEESDNVEMTKHKDGSITVRWSWPEQ
ncbi:DUF1654 domain-containing protein [Azorhizophilus paspali]|uniref:DUF1654 domain-containing protein n=1 Tax=Azorhizophilus paspali TaxID=69963 RepID=A0ABV6SI82_AZOPA